MTTPTTSSGGHLALPPDGLREARVRAVARALAAQPFLSGAADLGPHDERLQRILVDLTRGHEGERAEILGEIAKERGIETEEIVRRARFVLACLILPATGTLYETLGVRPDASRGEIRRQWSEAIKRYHPDRLAGGPEWLDLQAGRLIEAYQTLRDPVRRRRYDLELARRRSLASGPVSVPPARRLSPVWSAVGRGAVLLLLAAGVVGILLYAPLTPVSLPAVPVPPAPRLLDAWKEPSAPIPGPPSGAGTRSPGSTRAPDGRDSGSAPAGTIGERPAEPSGRAPNASLAEDPAGSTPDAGVATGTDAAEPLRPADTDNEASR